MVAMHVPYWLFGKCSLEKRYYARTRSHKLFIRPLLLQVPNPLSIIYNSRRKPIAWQKRTCERYVRPWFDVVSPLPGPFPVYHCVPEANSGVAL